MAPEVLEFGEISPKNDIWSLGILIYYLIFKEYPYNGKGEVQILKDIKSNKKLKKINDDDLNDLLNKMLKVNLNERISWDDYFNHCFFKKKLNIIKILIFLILIFNVNYIIKNFIVIVIIVN